MRGCITQATVHVQKSVYIQVNVFNIHACTIACVYTGYNGTQYAILYVHYLTCVHVYRIK